jgi:hypothetical protein
MQRLDKAPTVRTTPDNAAPIAMTQSCIVVCTSTKQPVYPFKPVSRDQIYRTHTPQSKCLCRQEQKMKNRMPPSDLAACPASADAYYIHQPITMVRHLAHAPTGLPGPVTPAGYSKAPFGSLKERASDPAFSASRHRMRCRCFPLPSHKPGPLSDLQV